MKRTKGFTLIEVLVSSAIVMMMSVLILGTYMGCQRTFVTGVELLNLNSQCRQTLQWFRRDIKAAYTLETSYTIGGTTYTTADDELVLKLPSVDAQGNIVVGVDYVVYHLNDADNTILERIVEANAGARTSGTYVIANDITGLIFSSGGTGLSSYGFVPGVLNVNINLTSGSQVLGGRDLATVVSTSITLRNWE